MRIDESHVKYERTFDEKPFEIARVDGDLAWDISKPIATRVAIRYRSHGWLVRVVKAQRGYTVYRSQNKAAFYN